MGNQPLLELLKEAEKHDVRIIFSGNSPQFSSVSRGEMFKVFSDRYGHVFLQDVQRQRRSIDRDVSKYLAFGKASVAVDAIARSGGFIWNEDQEDSIFSLVEKWANDRIDFPYGTCLILASTNREVKFINDLVHRLRVMQGEISNKEFECDTIFGRSRISEGDFIEFRENNNDLKIINGDQGVLISASKNKFVVAVDDKEVSFNPEEFTAFQLAYASTNYRSQGRTVDRCYLLYRQKMYKKLTSLYVGMSRHVRRSYCFVSKDETPTLMHLKARAFPLKRFDNFSKYFNQHTFQIF